ncbi:hypothetical protein HHK36_010677 [Tetracentron sinense]|uniref:Uncharacterized protein n=1 Tax=Tetracentron sinense TaxID=13715 RepID=A0A834Z8Y9_TETSI|nr:hypothetical protein HHK36_010677 [Tetracentron sinense]
MTVLGLGLGLAFSILAPIVLGFLFEKSFNLNFLNISLLLIFSMGFGRVISSFLQYMLPRKRTDGGEIVGEDSHNTEPLLKKRRINCLISCAATTGAAATMGNSNSSNNNINHSSSGVVKPPIIGLDDRNPTDIDEDLHSRQLAVYGRETMRKLFASNILISGMQGLGAEIGAYMYDRSFVVLVIAHEFDDG